MEQSYFQHTVVPAMSRIHNRHKKIVSDNSLTPYNKSALIDFLQNEFSLDIMFEKMETIFASDPMDYGTPLYGPSPVGLNWYSLSKKISSKFQKVETVNQIEANFLCGICDNEINLCQNLNNCIDGKCNCGNEVDFYFINFFYFE